MTGNLHIHKTNVYERFFDLEENCKEKIISEDYWDFIIPLYRDEELKEVESGKCVYSGDGFWI